MMRLPQERGWLRVDCVRFDGSDTSTSSYQVATTRDRLVLTKYADDRTANPQTIELSRDLLKRLVQ